MANKASYIFTNSNILIIRIIIDLGMKIQIRHFWWLCVSGRYSLESGGNIERQLRRRISCFARLCAAPKRKDTDAANEREEAKRYGQLLSPCPDSLGISFLDPKKYKNQAMLCMCRRNGKIQGMLLWPQHTVCSYLFKIIQCLLLSLCVVCGGKYTLFEATLAWAMLERGQEVPS